MASIMPPIPHYFFLYGEPILLFLGGFLNPILNPTAITTLLPPPLAGRGTSDPNPTPLEHLLGLQTAGMSLMVGMLILVIMVRSTEPRVVHAMVVSTVIGDLPHWGNLFYVLGWDGLRRWRTWDTTLWMMFLLPMMTMGVKLGYLGGAFGPDHVGEKEVMVKGKKKGKGKEL